VEKEKIRRETNRGESFRKRQLLGFCRSGSRLGVALLETFDATGGINVLLCAGEERMAFRADADAHVFVRGARFENGTARAVDDGVFVFWMNLFFHD
jgi:hypothetical protein